MYLHCKRGFVEADAWDGSTIPDKVQQREARRLKQQGGTTIIVRSRDGVTLVSLLGNVGVTAEVFHTPDWDYPFRVYLTVGAWAVVMGAVAHGLDYRNFKHWTGVSRNPGEHELALEIWQAALREGRRRGETG